MQINYSFLRTMIVILIIIGLLFALWAVFQEDAPRIIVNDTKNQFKFSLQKSKYFKNADEYDVREVILVHQPFNLIFETTKPTRCRLSLFPPTISQSSVSSSLVPLPEILLNDYEYKQKYDVTIRFPSSNFTQLNSYALFLRCTDNQGIKNPETLLKIKTKELAYDNLAPEIIEAKAKNGANNNSYNDFQIFVNEPFNSCRYSLSDGSFANMNAINCTTKESDIIYNANSPLGSFACIANAFIPGNATKMFFVCEDKNGNRNEIYKIDLS